MDEDNGYQPFIYHLSISWQVDNFWILLFCFLSLKFKLLSYYNLCKSLEFIIINITSVWLSREAFNILGPFHFFTPSYNIEEKWNYFFKWILGYVYIDCFLLEYLYFLLNQNSKGSKKRRTGHAVSSHFLDA